MLAAALLSACSPTIDAPTGTEPAAPDVQMTVSRFEDDFNYGHIRGASLFVVHGINGRDLNLDEALPVDVQVNGDCAVRGLRFRNIRGAIQLPGGRYSFVVRLAAATPCTGTAVITANDVLLQPGSNTSVVAHLNAAGAPTASVFENDLEGGPGDATVAARHTANFSAVDVAVRGTNVFTGVTNGQGGLAATQAGLARVQIFPAGTRTAAFNGRTVLLPNFLNVFYAVGTPANGTFEVLHQAIFLFGRTSARVSLLHGINGRDLGLSESLPVDFEVDGVCSLAGVTFRTVLGPRPLNEGTYDVKVRLANAAAPCTGAVAIDAPGVRFDRGNYYTVAAHLTASGTPTASVFRDDIATTTRATITARHTANFGAVDILFNGGVAFGGVTNGQSGSAPVPAGFQNIGIAPAGSSTPVFSARPLLLGGRFVNAFYAVGTPANGTFEVLSQRVFILF
ncbi:MAG: DUF4397 domain-containing protein [Gemmatimonadaceae bacterium]|nr:DUF4397 domain-containing protein [Gemmatimonadaceae bacterium]